MLHRTLPEPAAPTEADIETDATRAADEALERAQWHLRVLAEVAEIGLGLTRQLGELASARIEAAKVEGRALSREDDATLTAFNKAAQTLRRTIALREKIDAQIIAAKKGLVEERTRRRTELNEAHQYNKKMAIIFGVHDAYAAVTGEKEYDASVDNMMEDIGEHMCDADEFRGWLDRPVGETVTQLCAALGLGPDSIVKDGEVWKVRRPPNELEHHLVKRDKVYPRPREGPTWYKDLPAMTGRIPWPGQVAAAAAIPP